MQRNRVWAVVSVDETGEDSDYGMALFRAVDGFCRADVQGWADEHQQREAEETGNTVEVREVSISEIENWPLVVGAK
jgi:hypothetical protein